MAAKQLAGFGSKVQQLIGGSLSAAGLSVGSRTANGKTKAAVQQPTGGKTNSEAKVPGVMTWQHLSEASGKWKWLPLDSKADCWLMTN